MTPEPGSKLSAAWSPGTAALPALTMYRATGAQSGPNLLVTGGVHGDEYEGPLAGTKFFAALDPTRLAGTVTVLPVINVAAWQARRRRTPADEGDLNRAFPGDPAGGPTRQLAAAVFRTFVTPADAVIDLHSGGAAIMHLPMVGVPGTDERARRVLAAFDHRFYHWRMPDVAGVFSNEAHRAGKIAVGVEWGGGGLLDLTGVAALVDALARSLVALDMGDGGFSPSPIVGLPPLPPLAGDYQASPAAGLWTAAVRLGDQVKAGDPLGQLHDPFTGGDTTVPADRSGLVAALPHQAWVPAGAPIAYLG